MSYKCKYCGKGFSEVTAVAGHTAWCTKNPKRKAKRTKRAKRTKSKPKTRRKASTTYTIIRVPVVLEIPLLIGEPIVAEQE